MIPLQLDLQIAGPVSGDFNPPNPLQSCQDGNAGIQVVVTVLDQLANPANISAATGLRMNFMRPDGTTVGMTANFLTNGQDGSVYYTTSGPDLAQDGVWQVQASFSIAGQAKTTRWGQFQVGANIITP